jgi:hypothetical protein
MNFSRGIFSKCARLWVRSVSEWRTAQAAIHRSLSATTFPAFASSALIQHIRHRSHRHME